MRAFRLIVSDGTSAQPRCVDFFAESPDHAFQVARNEDDGISCELWAGDKLLARMTKSGANLWQLLPTAASSVADKKDLPLGSQVTHAPERGATVLVSVLRHG